MSRNNADVFVALFLALISAVFFCCFCAFWGRVFFDFLASVDGGYVNSVLCIFPVLILLVLTLLGVKLCVVLFCFFRHVGVCSLFSLCRSVWVFPYTSFCLVLWGLLPW